MTSLADELQPSIDAQNYVLTSACPNDLEEHYARAKDGIKRVAASWSKSNLDDQAACYGDVESPPQGRHLSAECGLSGVGPFNDTLGWEQGSYDDVGQRLDSARAQLKSPKPKRQIPREAEDKLVDFVAQPGDSVAAKVAMVVGL